MKYPVLVSTTCLPNLFTLCQSSEDLYKTSLKILKSMDYLKEDYETAQAKYLPHLEEWASKMPVSDERSRRMVQCLVGNYEESVSYFEKYNEDCKRRLEILKEKDGRAAYYWLLANKHILLTHPDIQKTER